MEMSQSPTDQATCSDSGSGLVNLMIIVWLALVVLCFYIFVRQFLHAHRALQPVGSTIINRHGDVIGWDSGAESLTGLPSKSMLGTGITYLLPRNQREEMRQRMDRAAESLLPMPRIDCDLVNGSKVVGVRFEFSELDSGRYLGIIRLR